MEADASVRFGRRGRASRSIVASVLLALSAPAWAGAERFQTVTTLEPDIWASIWLIDRTLGPAARVRIENAPRDRRGHFSFGFHGADLFEPDDSYFAALAARLGVTDPDVLELGRLVADIESLRWAALGDARVSAVETSFRGLQARHGHHWVPVGCYGALFDALLEAVGDGGSAAALAGAGDVGEACGGGAPRADISRPGVPETSPHELLERIGEGRRVLFVDTREPEEFAERRVPGAVNIPFRELRSLERSDFAEADIVVPYCVKDFRGYEAARLLGRLGIERVTLMDPYGLAGWLSEGLPVEGERGLPADEAVAALERCARDGCAADRRVAAGARDPAAGTVR